MVESWSEYPFNIADYDPLVDIGRQNIFESFMWPAESDFFSLDVTESFVQERHVRGTNAVLHLLRDTVPLRILFCESTLSSNIRTPFAANDAKRILSAYKVKPSFLFSSVGSQLGTFDRGESSNNCPPQVWTATRSFWYYVWFMGRSVYVYIHHDYYHEQILVIFTLSNVQQRASGKVISEYNDLRATVRNAIGMSLRQGKKSIHDPFAIQIPTLVFTESLWTQQASRDYASVERLDSLVPDESVMQELRTLATRIHLSKNSIQILQHSCQHLLSTVELHYSSDSRNADSPSDVTSAAVMVIRSLILRATATLCTVDSNLQRAQAAVDLGMAQLSYANGQAVAAIAQETRTDALSMQTIAFVTLAFLPGTFVAAFCSMTFFQDVWRLTQLWIYFVITVPLTALVLGAWWTWLRRRLGDADNRQEYPSWNTSSSDFGSIMEKEL